MAVSVLVSLEEYLGQSYHPDVDFLDGQLVERHVGELAHSEVQSSCLYYLRTHYPGYWSAVEARVQVSATRFRVPDVLILKGSRPATPILLVPPLVTIEVLSPSDRMHEMQVRIDDFLNFGVSAVWLIDPLDKRGFVYTPDGSREAKDGILRTAADPDLLLPLREVFGND